MKDEVNGQIAKERLHELTSVIDAKNLEFRKTHKVELDVLIESQKDDGLYQGFDQYFNKVVVKSDEDLSGNWITCKDYTVKDEYNYAEI